MISQMSRSHAQAEHLQFVDQRDVDAAVDILEQLGHLRGGGRGDGNGAAEDGAVQGASHFGGLRVHSANHLGNVAARHGGVAGILALRRKCDEEFLVPARSATGRLQAVLVLLLENRHHDFFRGAGVGCTLKDDQLAGLQMGSNRMCGVGDEAEIRFVILVEWSGDADDDSIHFHQPGIVRGCGKALRLGFPDFLRADAVDVRAALGEGVDFTLVDVEAGDSKLLFAEEQRERQPDIAQADDANARLALLDPVLELIGGTICGGVIRHRGDK